MNQSLILFVLSCSLQVKSNRINSKNLVLPQKQRPSLVKVFNYKGDNRGIVKHRHFAGIGSGSLFRWRRQPILTKENRKQRTREKMKERNWKRCGRKGQMRGSKFKSKRRRRLGRPKHGAGKSVTTRGEGLSGTMKGQIIIGTTKGRKNSRKKKQRRNTKHINKFSSKVSQIKSDKFRCKTMESNMKRKSRRRTGSLGSWSSPGFHKQMLPSRNYRQPMWSGNYQPELWSGNYRQPSLSGKYRQPSWSGSQRRRWWSGNQQPGYNQQPMWSGSHQAGSWSGNNHKPIWQRPTWQRPTWHRPTLATTAVVPTQISTVPNPTYIPVVGVDSDKNRQVMLPSALSIVLNLLWQPV